MVITIEDYLGGVSPLLNDDIVKMLLIDKGIEPNTAVADIEERDRDLLRADALLWCCTSPSTVGGNEEQVGNWKTKRAGMTLTSADRAMMKRMARRLYLKWDEPWRWQPSVRLVTRGFEIR